MAKAKNNSPSKTSVREHMGHSHSHAHDSTLLTGNKNDPGVRITRIGLYVNVAMAVSKGLGGYVFNSKALTADAVHSLTDLISDIATLATVSYSLRSPTPRFPLGYGKIESLGALAISCLLLGGGLMIGAEAITTLLKQFVPALSPILDHFHLAHSHSHSHALAPNINAAWLAAASIGIKEALYRATMRVATEKRSSLLASNAYHHRVDSLTALVALVSIACSNLLPNATWLDPVGGLLISAMIIQAGWSNTSSALLELADVGVDAEIHAKIHAAIGPVLPDGVRCTGLRGIKSGQNLLVDVELAAPEAWTLARLADVEERVRQAVSTQVRGVKKVAVRFVRDGSGDVAASEFVAFDRNVAVDAHSDDEGHDHGHDHKHKSKTK